MNPLAPSVMAAMDTARAPGFAAAPEGAVESVQPTIKRLAVSKVAKNDLNVMVAIFKVVECEDSPNPDATAAHLCNLLRGYINCNLGLYKNLLSDLPNRLAAVVL